MRIILSPPDLLHCTETTNVTEARILKRPRTEKPETEEVPPAQASKLAAPSCPVQPSQQEEPVPTPTAPKQGPAVAPLPQPAEEQPATAPPAHTSEQEPAAVPSAGPSSETHPGTSKDTPQQQDTPQHPSNRVLVEPDLL